MTELRKRYRERTPARVELGLTGVSLPTAAALALQLAQAEARDAVGEGLATVSLRGELNGLLQQSALPVLSPKTLVLRSAARDRTAYLKHPELGRRLAADSALAAAPCGLAIVVADGLSALAANRHAVPLLRELLARLAARQPALTLGPMALVTQGRVAVADEVGERLGAEAALILLGERPGLSAPDSLGAYLTWMPRVGRTDAERNCVSNIRPEGLGYVEAAERIADCLAAAARLRVTGVALGRRLVREPPLL